MQTKWSAERGSEAIDPSFHYAVSRLSTTDKTKIHFMSYLHKVSKINA
jgi:hypothetical protein